MAFLDCEKTGCATLAIELDPWGENNLKWGDPFQLCTLTYFYPFRTGIIESIFQWLKTSALTVNPSLRHYLYLPAFG